MRARLVIMLLLSSFALAAGRAMAQGTDFSGQWKLDPGRSELGEMAAASPEITLSIRKEGAAVLIEKSVVTPMHQSKKSLRYLSDGTEFVNAGESLKDLKGTARYEGAKLIVKSEQEGAIMRATSDAPPEIEYFKYASTEEYALSPDGRTLTIVQTAEMPDGSRTMTLVFNRVGA